MIAPIPPSALVTPPVPPSINRLAILSMVLGMSAWMIFPLLGAIGAIISGHLARRELRRRPAAQQGDGLALVGLVLGYLQIALFLLAFLVLGGLFVAIMASIQ